MIRNVSCQTNCIQNGSLTCKSAWTFPRSKKDPIRSLGFKIGALLILVVGMFVVIQVIDIGAMFHPERMTQ